MLPIILAKKSFVSLGFSFGKLQIVTLNTNKDAVGKFVEIDLPPTLVQNFKVQDKDALVKILKKCWIDLDLKERSVGIVVPEFSTLTKSLVLPKLGISDLDEAVRWRAQEFLPLPLEEMVLDWKITQKQEETVTVLSVAMKKEILESFVDAVGESGLYPLIVETPSISLSRISGADDSTKLIVYLNSSEAILVLAKGEDFIASSVVNAADINGIIWTAANIVRHYQPLQVKHVEIGGLKFTQELITSLQSQVGLPVHWIQPKISGLTAAQIQQFLIPISLQFKNPAEPADETTINLLPSGWVKKYHTAGMKLRAWSLLVISTIFILSCLAVTIGAYLFLDRNIILLKAKPLSQTKSVSNELLAQINQINSTSSEIIDIFSTSSIPQEIIQAVNKAKPSGITINSYSINLDSGKIILKGATLERSLLLQFKKNLEDNKKLSKVTIPVSNYEIESNAAFEITVFWQAASSLNGVIPIPKQ